MTRGSAIVGRWLWRGALWVGLPLVVGQTVGSPFFLWFVFGLGVRYQIKPQLFSYAISYYLWYWPSDLVVQKWALFCGLPGVMVTLCMMILAAGRRGRRQALRPQFDLTTDAPDPIRARSSIHGRARLLEPREAARLYRRPNPALGFIPIVECNRVDRDATIRGMAFDPEDPRTFGRGGTAKLVTDPMRRGKVASGVLIGGQGTGKSASFAIPAAHSYRGSMVFNDPSGEVSAVSSSHREDLGHTVAVIDPNDPALGAMNILKTIDLNDRMAPLAIKALVTEASGPVKDGASKEDNFFKTKGIALNTVLLADLLYSDERVKTVRVWRERISTPEKEMKKLLRSIYAHTRSSYARQGAGELMDTTEKTMSGIRSHATDDTDWLALDPLADLLSEDTFDPAELVKGRLTVYMQFPAEMMQSDPSAARVVLGSLIRSVMRAKGRVHSNVPFVIDEAYQLKHMESLAVARDQGRKAGIPLYTCWQSEGQIEEIWTAGGKKAFFNSAAWRMYLGGVDDPVTAKELSGAIGTYTALVPSEGSSNSASQGGGSRGTNQGLTLQAVPVLSEEQLRTSVRADEAIVLWRNHHAGRFGLANWYRRSEMVADLQPNPYHIAPTDGDAMKPHTLTLLVWPLLLSAAHAQQAATANPCLSNGLPVQINGSAYVVGCMQSSDAAVSPVTGMVGGYVNNQSQSLLDAFAGYIGRAHADVGLVYENQSDWAAADASAGWTVNTTSAPQKLSLAVPLLTASGGGTLEDVAAGKYDSHFKLWAQAAARATRR